MESSALRYEDVRTERTGVKRPTEHTSSSWEYFIERWRGSSKSHQSVEESTQSNSLRVIPAIMHQSWKSRVVPLRMARWAQTWKTLNPHYEYRLWTDLDNLHLCKRYFPWFLPTYTSFPHNIQRADVARYMYMYRYGGVYADLDVEALQPMDRLFDELQDEEDHNGGAYSPRTVDCVLPLMGTDYKFAHNVPNAWMACRPGHSFWLHVLTLVMKKTKENPAKIEGLTGPVVLKRAAKLWEESELASVEGEQDDCRPPLCFCLVGVIFPYDWNRDRRNHSYCSAENSDFNESQCKSAFRATGEPGSTAFSITYWSHTWGGKEIENIYNDPLSSTDNRKAAEIQNGEQEDVVQPDQEKEALQNASDDTVEHVRNHLQQIAEKRAHGAMVEEEAMERHGELVGDDENGRQDVVIG
ncbi:nucleotide-diphospho-sugar transferase [Cladochytrium replicatum]|nr:nucleotide-diphospho-sugar transferase [Cladochytrium replicatum]